MHYGVRRIDQVMMTCLKYLLPIACVLLIGVSIALVGGYVNQTGASYIQQDFSYVGAVATYTFVDWGKRKNVIRERKNLVAIRWVYCRVLVTVKHNCRYNPRISPSAGQVIF